MLAAILKVIVIFTKNTFFFFIIIIQYGKLDSAATQKNIGKKCQ